MSEPNRQYLIPGNTPWGSGFLVFRELPQAIAVAEGIAKRAEYLVPIMSESCGPLEGAVTDSGAWNLCDVYPDGTVRYN